MNQKPIARRAMPRRLWSLVRTAWPRRGLVAEACLQLAVTESRLKLFPLKRQGMRELVAATESPFIGEDAPSEKPGRQAALDVSWAVTRIASYFPDSAMCLSQALAARAMLRRRGIGSVLHLGVARSDAASLEAHAWLEAAGVEVTGYPVPPHLQEIGCLPSDGVGRT